MDRGANSYYYHYDGLGSTVCLTNSSGTKVEEYTYDVFGKPSAVSSVGNAKMFTGRDYDQETGLYYYRARMYSPELGRFLQTDPIGYKAGFNLYTYCDSVGKPIAGTDLNLYEYAHNNPVNFTDPYGLWYIDINISGGYIVGGTAGIIIGSKGIYTYEGPVATTPGVGGSIMWSPDNPTTGWNVAAQGMLIASYQRGYSFGKNGGWFSEYGLGAAYPTLGSLSGGGYYVHDPWQWPWMKNEKKEKKC